MKKNIFILIMCLITTLSFSQSYDSTNYFTVEITVAKYNGKIVGINRYGFSIEPSVFLKEDLEILQHFYGWEIIENNAYGTHEIKLYKSIYEIDKEKYRLTEGNTFTFEIKYIKIVD